MFHNRYEMHRRYLTTIVFVQNRPCKFLENLKISLVKLKTVLYFSVSYVYNVRYDYTNSHRGTKEKNENCSPFRIVIIGFITVYSLEMTNRRRHL